MRRADNCLLAKCQRVNRIATVGTFIGTAAIAVALYLLLAFKAGALWSL
jgi:hypothetical protein